MTTEQEVKTSKFGQFEEDFALLIESGFVAVKQFDEVSATRIFNAAQVLNPQSSAPRIGLGYIAMNKLELKKATDIFEKIIEAEPENYIAHAFLGLCYLIGKEKIKKGEKLIRNAMEKSDDPTIHNLGAVALEWSKKNLAAGKSPFFSKSEEKEEPEEEKTES